MVRGKEEIIMNKRKTLIASFASLFLAASSASALSWGELEGQIKNTLESLHLGRHSIESEYKSGKLILTGYVSTSSERERVAEALGKLDGISEVENSLEVKAGPGGSVGDDAIKKTALEAVKGLTGLGSYELDVAVEEGKLFISGTAASEKDRKRIEQAVQMAVGSKKVENRILLTPPPSDDQVVSNVWAALKKEKDLDTSGIEVTSHDGVVTITGQKPNHRVIDRILSIANMADGVREVKSKIKLG